VEIIIFLITASLGQEIESTKSDLLIAQHRISKLEQTINTLQKPQADPKKPSK